MKPCITDELYSEAMDVGVEHDYKDCLPNAIIRQKICDYFRKKMNRYYGVAFVERSMWIRGETPYCIHQFVNKWYPDEDIIDDDLDDSGSLEEEFRG